MQEKIPNEVNVSEFSFQEETKNELAKEIKYLDGLIALAADDAVDLPFLKHNYANVLGIDPEELSDESTKMLHHAPFWDVESKEELAAIMTEEKHRLSEQLKSKQALEN